MTRSNPLQTSAKEQTDVFTQRKFWGAISISTIGIFLYSYLSLNLLQVASTPAGYVKMAVYVLGVVLALTSLILSIRRQVEQALTIVFYFLLVAMVMGPATTQGRTLNSTMAMLVIGFILIRWFLPLSLRRRNTIYLASAFVVAWVFEWINPSWRIETRTAVIGPAIAILFLVILIALIARETWTRSLRNKLLILISSIVLMLIVGIVVVDYITSQREIQEDELQSLTLLYTDYLNDADTLEETAATLSTSLADRADIRQLYLSSDREGLVKLLTPMFETLRDEYDIRHLYIENLDGTVFVRIHNPESFGDDITYRPTAAAAMSARQTVAGVDIGPNRIGVRSVSPMYEDGRFIGLLEVGLDYDQAYIDRIKSNSNADYTLWITNQAAAPAGLQPVENNFTSPIPDIFFYSSTTTSQYSIEPDVYKRVLQTNQPTLQNVSTDTGEVAVLVAPLLGFGNRTIGIVEISISRAEALATLQANLNSEIVTGGVFLFVGLAVMWAVLQGLLVRPLDQLTAVAQKQLEGDLSARTSIQTKDELEQLGTTLNTVSAQLQDTLSSLEERVSARTKDLAIVAEVGSATSAILETTRLLQTVVDLTKERFGLYHSHIYLLDGTGENLVLTAGAGEPGRIMAAEKRSIPINRERSLVARAARERQGVIVNDVTTAPDFLPNPLLPDTRSELAVPMIVGDTLIGVFDIQSNMVDRFTDSDINIQTTLAAQLASSVQNARSYEQSKAQADFEATLNSISQKIQRAGTVEETLQTAIRELGTVLGAARVKATLAGYQKNNNTN